MCTQYLQFADELSPGQASAQAQEIRQSKDDAGKFPISLSFTALNR